MMEDIKRVYYGVLVVLGIALLVTEPPPLWAVGVALVFRGFIGYQSKQHPTRTRRE